MSPFWSSTIAPEEVSDWTSALGEKGVLTVIQMEITPTNGTPGDLEDDIAIFNNLGLVGLD